jgi:hypothetical protein
MNETELAKVVDNLRALEKAKDSGVIAHWVVGTMGMTGAVYGIRITLKSGIVVQELGRDLREAFSRIGGKLEQLALKGAAKG